MAAVSAIHESFTGPALHPALQWYCEPVCWSERTAEGRLRLEPEAPTDFWRTTHYGFDADNGHLLFAAMTGDFVMTTRVRFQPVHQYDQAGLMVRVSPSCWLKTSVEYEPAGDSRLGAIVTNAGYSDWSTQPFPAAAREVSLRIRRESQDYIVDASRDGQDWTQIRMAHLHEDRDGATVSAGLYACSPKAAGFAAEFAYLDIAPGRLPA
jgi:regulation of enolase protein 1 (concanavalin A-like superfamily)